MNAEALDLSVSPGAPAAPESRGQRQVWAVVALLIAGGVLLEAVFAGAMLSGTLWARPAHFIVAFLLTLAALAAGAVAALTLRHVPQGPRLARSLLAIGGICIAQAILGVASAKGAPLLWAHVPLGAALLALAAVAALRARQLGQGHA